MQLGTAYYAEKHQGANITLPRLDVAELAAQLADPNLVSANNTGQFQVDQIAKNIGKIEGEPVKNSNVPKKLHQLRIPTFSIDISGLEPAKPAEGVEGAALINGIFEVAGGDRSQESQADSESPHGEEPDQDRPTISLGDAARRNRSVIH